MRQAMRVGGVAAAIGAAWGGGVDDLAAHASVWSNRLATRILPCWYDTVRDLEHGGVGWTTRPPADRSRRGL